MLRTLVRKTQSVLSFKLITSRINLDPKAFVVAGSVMLPNYGLYAEEPINQVQVQKPRIVLAVGLVSPTTNDTGIIVATDARIALIEGYLKRYKAPLAAYAEEFVAVADKYKMDWRLLPAISVIESAGGNRIPKGSYNAWGWGIPTGKSSGIAFASWENAINTVAEGISRKYVAKGADTPEKMNKSYAASQVWGRNVRAAMTKISPTVTFN